MAFSGSEYPLGGGPKAVSCPQAPAFGGDLCPEPIHLQGRPGRVGADAVQVSVTYGDFGASLSGFAAFTR